MCIYIDIHIFITVDRKLLYCILNVPLLYYYSQIFCGKKHNRILIYIGTNLFAL